MAFTNYIPGDFITEATDIWHKDVLPSNPFFDVLRPRHLGRVNNACTEIKIGKSYTGQIMQDEITAEGITQREAIGRRALEVIGEVLEKHRTQGLKFEAAHAAVVAVADASLPFVDTDSKKVLMEVVLAWNVAKADRERLDAELGEVELTKDADFA